jgi:glyoxylase-like metal-dependent hydrolase (beta-lactamase superfamily II)
MTCVTQSWRQLTDDVWTGPTVHGPWINVVALGNVIVDSGLRWSHRRVARLLRGREVRAHLVTHAHADHIGSTAWLCRTTGADLLMGAADADRFEAGRIDSVASRLGRVVARWADPDRAPVHRRLREGDAVGSFRVLDTPGHSPGTVALWRPDDRVLVVGDGPVNLSTDPTSPRWLHLPRSLHHNFEQVRRSRQRLAGLEPALVVPVHGHPIRNPRAWTEACLR